MSLRVIASGVLLYSCGLQDVPRCHILRLADKTLAGESTPVS